MFWHRFNTQTAIRFISDWNDSNDEILHHRSAKVSISEAVKSAVQEGEMQHKEKVSF